MTVRWQIACLALSLVLIAVLTAFGVWETSPVGGAEWVGYQQTYNRLAAIPRGNNGGFAPEIVEIEIPALRRVDRCTTCHLGVADPAMAEAPAPFRTHSPILEAHPPETFGCTVCHGGVGRAVRLVEAHGEDEGGPDRLLRGRLIQSRCYVCHGLEALPPEDTALVTEGIKQINASQCLRCHQIDGAGGSEGPDLSAIASQRDWVEIYAHLLNPQVMSVGSTMPVLGLRREAATAITAFLLTRLDSRTAVRDVGYLAFEPLSAEQANVRSEVAVVEMAAAPNVDYDGAAAFNGLGCRVCHRVGLRGGEVGPALTHIARVRDETWLRALLTQPGEVLADGQMPAYALSEAQVEAVVAYLMSLR